MIKFFKKQSTILFGVFLVLLGATLCIYNGITAYAYYTNEEKMLEEFYKNDKNNHTDLESKSFFMNVIKDIDKFEEARAQIASETPREIDANTDSVKKNKNRQELDKYVAVLKIPKIKLEKGLYAKTSKYNSIEYNIMIHEASSNPEEKKGNVILVAHSGTADIAYFKNLYKLQKGDKAEIYYHGNRYTYKIVNTYDVEKTGSVEIDRDYNKESLTMITCRHGTNKQIVLISELVSVTRY